MNLQDKLDAFRSDFEAGKLPLKPTSEDLAAMHRGTRSLVDAGAAQHALKAGDTAPAFTLPDADGNPVSSAALLAQGPLVVTFYRGVWCPYCNMDLQALQALAPELEALGATLVSVSPQTPVNSRKSQRQNALTFPILSDAHNRVAAAFGLRFEMSPELVAVYQRFGNDLPTINGDASWSLPMPARYVIGQDGTILYAEVNPDYTRRPDPAELLPVLRAAQSRQG